MRNASPTIAPRLYAAGDPCPILSHVDGQPCGQPLEERRYYRKGGVSSWLRCRSWHQVRQCVRCLATLPSGARVDALYCSTRCRVAAHRERSA